MTTIKAIVKSDVKENRLLRLSARAEGLPNLVYAEDGFPHFRSSRDLEKGKEVEITITDKIIWEVESGDDILAGEAVYAGEEGKLFSRKSEEEEPPRLAGYAVHNAKAGELIKFVRSFHVNGNWAKKINEEINKEGE